jgi:uncharacterized C2H2 Zn-finger protein
MSEKIGDFLVRIGEIDTTQIDIICTKQLSGDKRKFGEIGQELGFINKVALHQYLEAKKAWKAGTKEISVGRIGDFLVRIGAMKSWQVQDVLRAQQVGDSRLFGEIAIEFSYINDEVLKKYVEAKEAQGKRLDMAEETGHKIDHIEIRCKHCGKWFRSDIHLGDNQTFDTSTLFRNLHGCPHCGKITSCNKKNVRCVNADGEIGFFGRGTIS